MLINDELLETALNSLILGVKQAQRKKGLVASEKSANSLYGSVAKYRNGLKGDIIGSAYFYQQQNGRLPGKFKKPPRALVEAIKLWVKQKGIDIPAYAIAYKINRDGIKVPNRFNSGGVLSEPLAHENVRELVLPIIRNFYGNTFHSLILGK